MLLLGLIAGCAELRRSAPSTLVPPQVEPSCARSTAVTSERVPPVSGVGDSKPISTAPPAVEPAVASDGYRWRDHPFSGGYFAGAIAGDPFHSGHGDDAVGLAISKRYGWDFAEHWGLETKLTDAWLNNSTRFNPSDTQIERALFWDASLMYYPWENTRFRPFVTLGAGMANFNVNDSQNQHVSRVLADVPFGLGFKYPIRDWLALRADLVDNLTIGGGGLPTMNNVVLMGGVEIRFGDLRKHFLPWTSDDASSTTKPEQ